MGIVGEGVDPTRVRRLPRSVGQFHNGAERRAGKHRSLSECNGNQRAVGGGVRVLQGLERQELRIVVPEQDEVVARHGDEAGTGRHGQHEQDCERNDQPPVAHNGNNVAVQPRRSRRLDHLGPGATSYSMVTTGSTSTCRRGLASCSSAPRCRTPISGEAG